MTPTRRILRELARCRTAEGARFVRPAEIPGFAERPDRFQKAVNDLLSRRLIEGRRDEEGRMAIALNDHMAQECQRVMRPPWARPAMWAWVAGAAGLAAVLARFGLFL